MESSQTSSKAHRSSSLLRNRGEQGASSGFAFSASRQSVSEYTLYTLNVIDVASWYKASRPLKTKKASEVAEMFEDIYKKGPLKYPKELRVDNGTEFKEVF